MTEQCRRHPDREGEWGLTSHYLFRSSWQQIVKAEQTFGPLCGECRSEFIEWVCTEAEGQR